MSNELPQLPPHPEVCHYWTEPEKAAIREYGRARERAAYERAAQVCKNLAKSCGDNPPSLYANGRLDAAVLLDERIRALGAYK